MTIGYIVGSLSQSSINRRLARAIARLAEGRESFVEIGIGDLPLYDRELEEDFPAAASRLKEQISSVDAILFVTPEYNRTIPAALKNALEWGARPYGQSAFSGIPAAVIGTSPGAPGASMAQQHLRNVVAYLDMPTLGQPEVFLQFDDGAFAADDTITADGPREFLSTWLEAFLAHVERYRG